MIIKLKRLLGRLELIKLSITLRPRVSRGKMKIFMLFCGLPFERAMARASWGYLKKNIFIMWKTFFCMHAHTFFIDRGKFEEKKKIK